MNENELELSKINDKLDNIIKEQKAEREANAKRLDKMIKFLKKIYSKSATTEKDKFRHDERIAFWESCKEE